jgi:hypothetical protein
MRILFRRRLTLRSKVKRAAANGRSQNILLKCGRGAAANGRSQNILLKCGRGAIASGRSQNRILMRGGRV